MDQDKHEKTHLMDANQRRRTRVEVRVTASFTPTRGVATGLRIRNISLKGLLAEAETQTVLDATGLVRITLTENAVIEIEAQVIRSEDKTVAIDFLNMDELSFLHLRNLVRYNAPDADQIDAELKHPAFD